MEKIILVDENDNQIGTEEKLRAHRDGKLHRAFSIYVFNSDGDLLLQRRADDKYHSGGLWTNTCCSHPRHGEEVDDAAHRRLLEEMGLTCNLKKAAEFIYRVDLDNDLTEHEYLHVYVGSYNNDPDPNPEEVGNWKWVSMESLEKDITENPSNYTYWFRVTLPKLKEHL